MEEGAQPGRGRREAGPRVRRPEPGLGARPGPPWVALGEDSGGKMHCRGSGVPLMPERPFRPPAAAQGFLAVTSALLRSASGCPDP